MRARKELEERLEQARRDSRKYQNELQQAQKEAESYKDRLQAFKKDDEPNAHNDSGVGSNEQLTHQLFLQTGSLEVFVLQLLGSLIGMYFLGGGGVG